MNSRTPEQAMHEAGVWADLKRREAVNLALELFLPERFYNSSYRHAACDEEWTSIWDCACDDECPSCGASVSPHDWFECDEDGNEIGDDDQ
jgi:hypothetical protein